jgi:tRNA pseudouridine13 synthase
VARFVASPETFVVEEIPAYQPSGEGEHTYLWIEKRGLTTPEAERRLGQALRVSPRDIGHAGMKDRHATTRQYLSLLGTTPEAALAAAGQGGIDGQAGIDGLTVLAASRHGNKLRMGHLKGNRFEVVLTEVAAGEAAAIAERLAELGRTGLPNWYGEQRFGAAGDNTERALAIVQGRLRERDWKKRQFLLSALQSAVFNRTLELRQAEGLLRVRPGDVLQKRESGGLFVCEDPAVDQPRVDAGELVPTGPLPGNREKEPPEGTAARALEDEALAAVGVTRAELAPLGRDLPGARRPVVVAVELGDPPATDEGGGHLRLRFGLPSGSYATVVVRALGVTGD